MRTSIIQCDYQVSQNCTKEIAPNESATPHNGFVDKPNLVKYACSPCENCFDE